MNIQFRNGSEALSEKLIAQAQIKLQKLSRFIPEQNYEAQVYVDVERESGSNKSESLWRASINLSLAGERFNAGATGSTPEKATNLAIKELKREVSHAHAKRGSIKKKGSSLLKRLRQGFI